MNEYENTRRVVYDGGATFVPICEQCGRFVKEDDAVSFSELAYYKEGFKEPNATCSKCGRTNMLFEGFY